MKKFLFPIAIVCALYSVAFVTPASALPVTSDLTAAPSWSTGTPPPPPGPAPAGVPTVKVVVDFESDNPNTSVQSFNEAFYLFNGIGSTSTYLSTQTLSKNIDPGVFTYSYVYQNNTTDTADPNSEWTLYFNLPGDTITWGSLRESTHKY
ncbi:hypothetical protein EON83_03350 [bacterium]|nr:MAG: hypothetical protein EON83_03350 [bacterium]